MVSPVKDLPPPAEPASRLDASGRVLSSAGLDPQIRWRPGQRLEHLFEAQVDALGDAPAVDGPGGG